MGIEEHSNRGINAREWQLMAGILDAIKSKVTALILKWAETTAASKKLLEGDKSVQPNDQRILDLFNNFQTKQLAEVIKDLNAARLKLQDELADAGARSRGLQLIGEEEDRVNKIQLELTQFESEFSVDKIQEDGTIPPNQRVQ